VRLPHSAVPEEFDALAAEADVDLAFVDDPAHLGVPDLVILPGSEATIPDIDAMRERGMDLAVRRAAEGGSLLFGICGGFQMMGTEVLDPERLEGGAERARGLGIFDLETTMTRDRIDAPASATAAGGGLLEAGERVSGFELHGGKSVLRDADVVSLFSEQAAGGGACPLAIATRDYAAMGTYLHGILADPVFRGRILAHLRARRASRVSAPAGSGNASEGAASPVA
jgi:adenosylcobyric acid synthase